MDQNEVANLLMDTTVFHHPPSDSKYICKPEKVNHWDPHPKPPRKWRTPYAYFVSDYYRRYRRFLRTNHPGTIYEYVHSHWTTLESPEKIRYNGYGKKDRDRFNKELKQWKAHFNNRRIPRVRRKRKNPLWPKRTRNAYMWYQQEVLPEFRQSNPGVRHRQLISKIGKSWHDLTVEEKMPYLQRFNLDKARYARELGQYRFERAKRISEQAQDRKFIRLEKLRKKNLQEKYGPDYGNDEVNEVGISR